MQHPDTRNTIFSEDAEILEHKALPASQFVMRLLAHETAAHASPGAFVHLQCHPDLPMRRPMSIMRADPNGGWIEILYKLHGEGTGKLALRKPGECLPLLGPIGVPFKRDGYKKFPLLIGGGVGIPPMVFLSDHLRRFGKGVSPLVIMGSEIPFPFTMRPSRIMVQGMPEGTIAAMPLLEDWDIPSRLCSLQGYPGCYPGFVTDLARYWLEALPADVRQEVEIFSCGPMPMLRAVSRLAQDYALACQVSVEEYMACGVGGCAGCAIEVHTPEGPAMKRVCVDGPVFDAASIFPAT